MGVSDDGGDGSAHTSPAPDAPEVRDSDGSPPGPKELIDAAGNTAMKRLVPVVSLAAIGALVFRSLRRRSG